MVRHWPATTSIIDLTTSTLPPPPSLPLPLLPLPMGHESWRCCCCFACSAANLLLLLLLLLLSQPRPLKRHFTLSGLVLGARLSQSALSIIVLLSVQVYHDAPCASSASSSASSALCLRSPCLCHQLTPAATDQVCDAVHNVRLPGIGTQA